MSVTQRKCDMYKYNNFITSTAVCHSETTDVVGVEFNASPDTIWVISKPQTTLLFQYFLWLKMKYY